MKDKFKVIGVMLFSLALVAGAGEDIEEGKRLYEEGKYDEALTKYSDAQADDPESPEIFFDIGNVYYRRGEYEKALDLYKKAAEKEGEALDSSAYYNMGNAKFQLGKPQSSIPLYEEAVKLYKQALTIDPGDADAKNNLEYLLMEIEKLKQEKEKEQEQEQEQEQEDEPEEEEKRLIRAAPDIE